MSKEIQVLASDRHVNVVGLNRLLGSLLYAVFIVSLLLWDKAMGAIFKLYQVSFQLDDGGFRFVLDEHA